MRHIKRRESIVTPPGLASRRTFLSGLALGATCVAMVVSIGLLELTSEYLTFTSVTQEFWMLTGLLSAAVTQRRPAGATFVALSAEPPGRLPRRGLLLR